MPCSRTIAALATMVIMVVVCADGAGVRSAVTTRAGNPLVKALGAALSRDDKSSCNFRTEMPLDKCTACAKYAITPEARKKVTERSFWQDVQGWENYMVPGIEGLPEDRIPRLLACIYCAARTCCDSPTNAMQVFYPAGDDNGDDQICRNGVVVGSLSIDDMFNQEAPVIQAPPATAGEDEGDDEEEAYPEPERVPVPVPQQAVAPVADKAAQANAVSDEPAQVVGVSSLPRVGEAKLLRGENGKWIAKIQRVTDKEYLVRFATDYEVLFEQNSSVLKSETFGDRNTLALKQAKRIAQHFVEQGGFCMAVGHTSLMGRNQDLRALAAEARGSCASDLMCAELCPKYKGFAGEQSAAQTLSWARAGAVRTFLGIQKGGDVVNGKPQWYIRSAAGLGFGYPVPQAYGNNKVPRMDVANRRVDFICSLAGAGAKAAGSMVTAVYTQELAQYDPPVQCSAKVKSDPQ